MKKCKCGRKIPKKDELCFKCSGGKKQMPKTPLEYCSACNCYYYDITGKKLCPHEEEYPHAEIHNPSPSRTNLIFLFL